MTISKVRVLMASYLAVFTLVSAVVFVGCTTAETEVVEVIKEVVVEKEVVKEVEVPGATVIKEVVKEVEIPVTQVVDLDPGKLVIYSGRKESLIGNIVTQFEEVTGVEVEVKWGKTFPMATMIIEEGANSPADVYIAQDPGGLGFLSNAGRLHTLDSDITDRVVDWAKPDDNSWIGLSGRSRVLVHTDGMAELPVTLKD